MTRQTRASRLGWADLAGWAAIGTAGTLAPAVTVWIVVRTLAIGGVVVTNPAAILTCYLVSWVIILLTIGLVAEVMDQ